MAVLDHGGGHEGGEGQKPLRVPRDEEHVGPRLGEDADEGRRQHGPAGMALNPCLKRPALERDPGHDEERAEGPGEDAGHVFAGDVVVEGCPRL